MKCYLKSLGLSDAGDKFLEHRIDSEMGENLEREDFIDMGINNISDRKKIIKACKNLQHPLFKTFLECDVDKSFKIDAIELSHVMTRIQGKAFSETDAKKMSFQLDLDF
jgi:hypothetical protein